MSSESKVSFWVISTNVLLIIFTFIFGLFIQYIVANTYSQSNKRLAHFEIVEKVLPEFNKLQNMFILTLSSMNNVVLEEMDENTILKNVVDYFNKDRQNLISEARLGFDVFENFMYYIDNRDEFDKFQIDNQLLFLGIYTLLVYDENPNLEMDEFINQINTLITDQNKTFFRGTNINDMYKKAYTIYSNNDIPSIIMQLIINPFLRNYNYINGVLSPNIDENNWTQYINIKSLSLFSGVMFFAVMIWLFICRILVKKVSEYTSDQFSNIKNECNLYKTKCALQNKKIESLYDEIKMKKALISELDITVQSLENQIDTLTTVENLDN